MRVVDPDALDRIRALPCAWCGARPLSEAAHLFARGHGGGLRVDLRQNLVSLCRLDHQMHHDGHEPTRVQLLAVVAAREGITVEQLQDLLWRVMRAEKGSDLAAFLEGG